MYMENVWRFHGTPLDHVSDRGPQFASKVMKGIFDSLGIERKLSTAYHPQTDGITEARNKWIKTYLSIFCNEHRSDWVDYIHLAEFAYNNSLHDSIKVTPFYANYAQHPRFNDDPLPTENQEAGDITDKLREIWKEIRNAQAYANHLQQRTYDKHRGKEPQYEVGQRVWLATTNLRSPQKLPPKRAGPFEIIEKIGDVNYRLGGLDTRIHDVFHVSLLREVNEPAGKPIETQELKFIPETETFIIEGILDSRDRHGKVEILAKWEDFDECRDDEYWIPLADIIDSEVTLLDSFFKQNPNKPGSSIFKRKMRSFRRKDP